MTSIEACERLIVGTPLPPIWQVQQEIKTVAYLEPVKLDGCRPTHALERGDRRPLQFKEVYKESPSAVQQTRIASISTAAPKGSAAACMATLAGNGSGTYSAIMRFTA